MANLNINITVFTVKINEHMYFIYCPSKFGFAYIYTIPGEEWRYK